MAIGSFRLTAAKRETLKEKITIAPPPSCAALRASGIRTSPRLKGVVSKSFTDGEELEKNLIDLVAKDEAELLQPQKATKPDVFRRGRILHLASQPITDTP
jgi:hypothetical protein